MISETNLLSAKVLGGVGALAVSMGASNAVAADLWATPSTLSDVLSRAKGGDSITLAAGEYTGLRLDDLHFNPPVVLEAGAATVSGWWIHQSSGMAFHGGTFALPPPTTNPKTGAPAYTWALRGDGVDQLSVKGAKFVGPGHPDTGQGVVYGEGYGFFVNGGSHIELDANAFSGFKSALVLGKVTGFRVANNTFTAMRSDGIDLAESRDGLVEGNQCSGTVIRDLEHPDCIQLWSRPTSPPTADIVIRKNKVEGNTQGISLFNHVRDGVDDGGFDRITIEDNEVNVSYPHAIAGGDMRDSVIRNNHVKTYPGTRWHAAINLLRVEARRCGNVVEPGNGKPGSSDSKC